MKKIDGEIILSFDAMPCLAGRALKKGKGILLVTKLGGFYIYDPIQNKIKTFFVADHEARTEPAVYIDRKGNTYVVYGSSEGCVYKIGIGELNLDGLSDNPTGVDCMVVDYESEYREGERYAASFYGKFYVFTNVAYIPFLRDTYYRDPPVVCVDLDSMSIIWRAKNALVDNGDIQDIGNIRNIPIMFMGNLVLCPSYDDGLIFIDRISGTVTYRSKLGEYVFQQWSGFTNCSTRFFYLAKTTGDVVKYDLKNKRIVWSQNLYAFFKFKMSFLNKVVEAIKEPPQPLEGNNTPVSGVTSPCAYKDEHVVICTVDGYMYCLFDENTVATSYDVVSEYETKFTSQVDRAKPYFDSIRNLVAMSTIAVAIFYLNRLRVTIGLNTTQLFGLAACIVLYVKCGVYMFKICKPGTKLFITKALTVLGFSPKENKPKESLFYSAVTAIEVGVFYYVQLSIHAVIAQYIH